MSTNGASFFQRAIEDPEISVPAAVASAAAVAATVWAFKGAGLSLIERLSPTAAKADQVSPFISLGGELTAQDLAWLEKAGSNTAPVAHVVDAPMEERLDALSKGLVLHEDPDDATFARALLMASEHDYKLGRMAAQSAAGGMTVTDEARFGQVSRLAAERGKEIGST